MNKYFHHNLVMNNEFKSNNIIIENDKKKLRIYYFDILRIVSSFSVILIHVSAKYYLLPLNSNNN